MSEEMLEREPSSHSKVPVSHKIAWGVGGLACDMVNALWILALPIFSVGLGVKASLMGLALALPRIVDGVLDPVLGSLSDNTHSRWGVWVRAQGDLRVDAEEISRGATYPQ